MRTGPPLVANRPVLGQLLETLVFQELRRQASWHDDPLAFLHYRDKDGVEKDVAGKRFAGGVVLYDGETSASFGDGLHAVPIRALWETN